MVIELKNEKVTVQFKEFGVALSSIKDQDGIEYLWQGNPAYWSSQAPVLFPICGSLRNDKGIYTSKKHSHRYGSIPRHGLVRKKNFRFEQLGKDSVVFTITPDKEMLMQYPYHFELKIIYTLKHTTIRTEYQVINKEKESIMPYFIGGHPGLNCPLFAGDRYEDYYLEFEKEETCTVPKSFPDTGLLDLQDRKIFLKGQKYLDLDYSLFTHDAITLDNLQSRSVSLRSKNHGGGLRLDFADFPYLILWSTANKGPFIALEPWSGLSTAVDESDYFEEKRNVSFVEPGQFDRNYFDITVL